MTGDELDESGEVGNPTTLIMSHEKRLNVHAQRLRALEDFRLLHQQTEKMMRDSLEKIEKHLASQDNSLEIMKNKMSRWGGAITVIIAIPAAVITIVEVLRLLKV